MSIGKGGIEGTLRCSVLTSGFEGEESVSRFGNIVPEISILKQKVDVDVASTLVQQAIEVMIRDGADEVVTRSDLSQGES